MKCSHSHVRKCLDDWIALHKKGGCKQLVRVSQALEAFDPRLMIDICLANYPH